MDEKNKKRSPEVLNTEYFRAFTATRGSIGMLIMSLPSLVFALIFLPILWDVADRGYQMNPMRSLPILVLIGISIFMAVTFVAINFIGIRKLLAKHQFFASGWLATVIALLTFILMFASYMMTQYGDPKDIRYGSNSSVTVIIIFLLVYLGAMIYNFFWLKKQLQVGFSEKRKIANYFASNNVYQSKSIGIISGLTLLAAFFTGNLVKILGIALGLLFACAFSRLTIEIIYATYLLGKGQEYWVTYTEEPGTPWKERVKARFRKMSTYVILGIIILAGIPQIEQFYDVPDYVHVVLVYLSKGILLGLALAFVGWGIKKIKMSFNKEKKK